MPTVSAQKLTVSGQLLATGNLDKLLRRIEIADEVIFELTTSFSADLLKVVMVAAALSRRDRRISVKFAPDGPSSGVRESLSQTLLGPILGVAQESREGILSHDVGFRRRGYVDPQRRLFCLPTGLLDCDSRERFLNDLSDAMRSANILLPEGVLTRVAALAFEPNQNAEEHGSMRVDDLQDVFRCTLVRVHDQPGPSLSASAKSYIDAYHQYGHATRTRWLEVIVADAGMGLAFPLFYVRARATRSTVTDVYEAGTLAERATFSELLWRRGTTTKGYWGTARTSQTTTGQGHHYILRNVLRLHAYAAVRAGRCYASISYPNRLPVTQGELRQTEFQVDEHEFGMYHGTVWHLLVPIDQQLTLGL